jgi:cyclopropane fatty-acyl-phospholipid synthase-like methyltransferase
MAFVLSRYKFVAKMLENREKVMEVGCGDGFGTVLVAQSTGGVYAVDWNENLVRDNTERLKFVDNLQFVHHDMNSKPAEDIKVSAIYSIDVIEHIDPANEDTFMNNMIQSYENKENAVMIIGTPNVTAAQYASQTSAEGHINLKSHDDLKALLQRHFHNVFMFGMNDEVVHTGYAPMCHYLWGIGAGLK